MAKNLVLDAQLSKDSYTFNNSGSGASNGWARISVTQRDVGIGRAAQERRVVAARCQ